MSQKIFISYSHKQGTKVLDCIAPLLVAGGAQLLIDRTRFKLGLALFDQMDALQDQADRHLLCFSSDYLASQACQHEMDRAIALDSDFKRGIVVPIKLGQVDLPADIQARNPLYADLRSRRGGAWDRMLTACGSDLGGSALEWLEARDEIRTLLGRDQGVNLVVKGDANWTGLIDHLRDELQLAEVDLESGATATREGLMRAILRALGLQVGSGPLSLETFEDLIIRSPRRRLALTHFHYAAHRLDSYDMNFFGSLRHLTMTRRKLVLLVQSRQPFMSLLPSGHPLSELILHQVQLNGRP